MRRRRAQVAARGLWAPPASANANSTAVTEIIHTTAKHPWLMADHGWELAGSLQVG